MYILSVVSSNSGTNHFFTTFEEMMKMFRSCCIDNKLDTERLCNQLIYSKEAGVTLNQVVLDLDVAPKASPTVYTKGVLDIVSERATHDSRGWTAEHDAKHGWMHLVRLARGKMYKSDITRDDLVKAASLILAAIEQIDRTKEV